jgi:hypothetical protein
MIGSSYYFPSGVSKSLRMSMMSPSASLARIWRVLISVDLGKPACGRVEPKRQKRALREPPTKVAKRIADWLLWSVAVGPSASREAPSINCLVPTRPHVAYLPHLLLGTHHGSITRQARPALSRKPGILSTLAKWPGLPFFKPRKSEKSAIVGDQPKVCFRPSPSQSHGTN